VRRVQKQTKRIYSILYSERLENPATIRAAEMVWAGAIGKGRPDDRPWPAPDQPSLSSLPGSGIGSISEGFSAISPHTSSISFFTSPARPAPRSSRAQVRNVNHPQYPLYEDFGDAMLRGNSASGISAGRLVHARWTQHLGDGRLTVIGTEGFMELRKYTDLSRSNKGNHLFIVDQKETRYIDCSAGRDAVRRAAGRRRPQPDRDGHVTGALLPRDRAGASRTARRAGHKAESHV
jgi:predicted dehydrogenase